MFIFICNTFDNYYVDTKEMSTLEYKTLESAIDNITIANNSTRILSEDERNNIVLDNILEVQKGINKLTEAVIVMTNNYEKISWIELPDDLKERVKTLINDSIEVKPILVKHYVFLKNKVNKIASESIKEYKIALDDFRETLDDIYNILYVIPENETFQKINKQLEEL